MSSISSSTSAFAVARAKSVNARGLDQSFEASKNVSSEEISQVNFHPSLSLQVYDEKVSDLGFGPFINKSAPSMPFLIAKDAVLSTWKPTPSSVYQHTDNHICLTLEPLERISLIGEYQLLVKSGSIWVYGAVFKPSATKHLIFAPSSHAIPSITCCDSGIAEIEIWESNLSIRSLSLISPLFRHLWNFQPSEVATSASLKDIRTESFAIVSQSCNSWRSRLLHPLDIPVSWRKAVHESTSLSDGQNSRVMACGPKGTGKSTLCRLITNVLWSFNQNSENETVRNNRSSTFWLDIDPGQPEFTPPGQISLLKIKKPLFGPPFTQDLERVSGVADILKAHFVGSIDVEENSKYYVECVADLLSYFESQTNNTQQSMLIINCPGWIAGTAIDILVQIIDLSAPTKLFVMDAGHPDSLNSLKQLRDRFSLELLSCPVPTEVPSRTAADLRAMQTISYFHRITHAYNNPQWTNTPIMEQDSWNLKYGLEGGALRAIMVIGESPSPEHICSMLEGRLVGIAIFTGPPEKIQDQDLLKTSVGGIPFWSKNQSGQGEYIKPRYTRLIGLALLKRVDATSRSLQLQIPRTFAFKEAYHMCQSDNSKHLILMTGRLDTPGWAYLEHLYFHQAARMSQSKVEKPPNEAEDLSIDESKVKFHKELSNGDSEIDEDMPWVRVQRMGESTGKRWRARRDLGRSGLQC